MENNREANMTEYIRNHPIVVLAGSVLLGITLTGSFIVFTATVFQLELVTKTAVIPWKEVADKYVEKSEYERLYGHFKIIVNRDVKPDFERIFAIRRAFQNLSGLVNDDTRDVDSSFVKAYNSYAQLYNSMFSESKIPIFAETSLNAIVHRGPQNIVAVMELALAVIEGEYYCLER